MSVYVLYSWYTDGPFCRPKPQSSGFCGVASVVDELAEAATLQVCFAAVAQLPASLAHGSAVQGAWSAYNCLQKAPDHDSAAAVLKPAAFLQ